ncbi:YcxB family protein [Marinobacterium jannaschii]|uniref:YcxB family protein n=1 Tax=Marinobacterium jannaschii TaxID=64970 RepID=UPI00056D3259|nr:YcxB family protein [Marinobacterium jannaschii]
MTDTDTSTNHSSYYILNREYFTECFDQSANTAIGLKAYRKAIILITGASIFFAMDIEVYVAWFLLALGGVELLSIRYKRSWWVARQMLSRAAGSQVSIRIDDQGIFTDNTYHQKSILWNDISEIKSTEKGFIVIHNQGTSYLSKNGLDKFFLDLLAEKSKAMI